MKKFSFLYGRLLAFMHDVLWVPIAIIVSYWVRFNLGVIPDFYWLSIYQLIIAALLIQTVCYWYFGLYRGIWRFASIPDLFRILKAVLVGVSVTLLAVFLFSRLLTIPRSIFILYPVLLFLGLCSSRLIYRFYKDRSLYLGHSLKKKQALIVGAGRAGEMLVRDMLKANEYFPVGFIDDDEKKLNRDIQGVTVLDILVNLDSAIEKLDIELVIISIRNLPAEVMRDILRACSSKNIECKTVPSLLELDQDSLNVSLLREVKIEDLLGRDVIKLDDNSLSSFLEGKCVLVTGAGGSIGSELSRQAAKYLPNKLILLDQSEFNLYTIINAIKDEYPNLNVEVVPLLRDIRDAAAIDDLMRIHRPNIVLHAAAYKHVPIIEDNILEGVKTNIFGTKKLAEMASKYSVEKFVMVSTDKAVNPTSLMGTTKRAAEIFCQALDKKSSTKFVTTRFGNVLDSTGSVVPLFREQIKKGGPITVTHQDITRFFMSIPEAVSLILQAGSMGEGGEIFVLDMGKPIKIYDLARQMIRLSGFDPDHEIGIEITGLRPGEKLYEELFHESEDYSGTKHPKILLATSRKVDWDVLTLQIEDVLHECEQRDNNALINSLSAIIPEYTNNKSLSSDKIAESSAADIIH